jgi:transcriptional regulator GlxA family with amidase domain
MYNVCGPTERRHARIWRLIQRYASDPTQTASIDELSGRIAVSPRTLRNVCHEHGGMAPARYVKSSRMELAHEMLCRASSNGSTVTSIANFCGFLQLGRFSVEYRRLFGHPPSVTLCDAPLVDRRVLQAAALSPIGYQKPLFLDDYDRRDHSGV